MVQRGVKEQSELYIYSMFSFGATAGFISVCLFSGFALEYALLLIGLMCTSMTLSSKWQNLGDITHTTVISVSTLLLLVFVIYCIFTKHDE